MAQKIRVFISLPMNDKTNEEIKRDISFATGDILSTVNERVEVECVTSFLEGQIEDKTPAQCLASAINKLSDCDFVYLYGPWWKSRGCKLERDFAIAYSIPIFSAWSINEYLDNKIKVDHERV